MRTQIKLRKIKPQCDSKRGIKTIPHTTIYFQKDFVIWVKLLIFPSKLLMCFLNIIIVRGEGQTTDSSLSRVVYSRSTNRIFHAVNRLHWLRVGSLPPPDSKRKCLFFITRPWRKRPWQGGDSLQPFLWLPLCAILALPLLSFILHSFQFFL